MLHSVRPAITLHSGGEVTQACYLSHLICGQWTLGNLLRLPFTTLTGLDPADQASRGPWCGFAGHWIHWRRQKPRLAMPLTF